MRLFKTIFNVVKLPLVVAKDAVCALPDASMGKRIFSDSEKQCEKIDDSLSNK